jgi:MtrB/PioB family decaheme-associated outer membrane protein
MQTIIISTRGVARMARGALALLVVTLGAAPAAGQTAQPAAPPPAPEIRTVDIGVGGVSDGSFKAGEYNGLENAGAFTIVNLDLRDKTPYGSTSARRWVVRSWDLGLESRSAVAEFKIQGKVRVTGGFDQLLRNRSDTYQTPFDGAGTDTLTLPAGWLVPVIASPAGTTLSARGLVPAIGTAPYLSTAAANQGATIAPTQAQIDAVNVASAVDLPLFRDVNLFTKRTAYVAGVTFHATDRWTVEADVRPEHKDGTKPMGTVSRNTGGDISTIIPDRIDNDHTQVNTNLQFAGRRGAAQVGYYGSFFNTNVPSMSWQNWATSAKTVNTMSSAPSNMFWQANGSGTVKMGATTKLVATGSYGRATQNDAFLTDSTTALVPVSSLNGLVATTLVNARLTSRPGKINLSANYRFNDRDNRTAVHIFQYADAGENPAVSTLFPAGPNNQLGAVLAQNANANRPYGRTQNQVALDAEIPLGGGESIKGGYDFDRIDRQCNGSWISCEDAERTNENTLRVDWRASMSTLTARVGYAHSERRAPAYNENAFLALVPYANVSPTTATGGATAYSFMTANGWGPWGPPLGFSTTTGNQNVFFPMNNALANGAYANNNRISEVAGFRRYWVADRDRDKVRSLVSWQANDVFSLQGGVDVNRDIYGNSPYGLQNGKGWSGNVDVSYAPTDNFSADVYYTYENLKSLSTGNSYTANSNTATITNGQPGSVGLSGNVCNSYTTLQQRNNNNKIDPCTDWSSDTLDAANTVGVGVRDKVSKVGVTADLFFTRVRSDNTVTIGSWSNNPVNGLGGPPTSTAAYYIPASPMPTVTDNSAQLRLNAIIPIAKKQSIHAAYTYMKLTSGDWIYEGMQTGLGTIAGVLPSNEQPFNYSVNIFGVSYLLTF